MKPPTSMSPSPSITMRPWRFVLAFGSVSLLADFVYEGARSVTGPLLAGLGASAVLVGIVTGAGEGAAMVLRLVSGPLADRTKRFWAFTIAGYALTVVTVPLLGIAGALWVACALVIAERVGKAVRSPAKDTLLSHATAATGRGRGFAVHEALDQIGAVIGPLVVAGVLVLSGGDYGPALLALAAPGARPRRGHRKPRAREARRHHDRQGKPPEQPQGALRQRAPAPCRERDPGADGWVQLTITDGVVHDAVALRADVREIVRASRALGNPPLAGTATRST